ncbi:nucleotide exchange factor GrpE [[Clostridium] polysaccharolyticum]|uniref:Protein GrpE n=1 Tax=[Clostridium] polysaccharolyticum TaxID=29364 RepID=A0A1H9ZQ36_9FIRM|nr:nucleotide exchange factor GrpE [[Clostridium] polysaccharolyticum]SES83758.1 molecular chaperone GrpE [[Clostridium] polysaccharolyticum]
MKQKEKTKVEENDTAAEDAGQENLDTEQQNLNAQAEGEEEKTADAETADAEKAEEEDVPKGDKKAQELNDKLMRTIAEFDNFRKRSEKEKSAMFEIGAKAIIEKILPVLDNFERGLDSISEEEKGSAFAQGIEQIYKQFVTVLDDAGVKVIETVGKEFDPSLHNAVMHVEDDSLGENIIAEEFQKGYMYKESVVRHSMVKVAN